MRPMSWCIVMVEQQVHRFLFLYRMVLLVPCDTAVSAILSAVLLVYLLNTCSVLLIVSYFWSSLP